MLIRRYKNGNYTVTLLNDGTKIRYNELDNLTPDFPENIDLKITNKCDMGCPMCHEMSTPCGKEADINKLIKFIRTLHPHTEVALGGGNPLDYEYIENLLYALENQSVISNMTINGKHLMNQYNIQYVYELQAKYSLMGIGVSLNDGDFEPIIKATKDIPNVVYHVINGLITDEQINTLKKYPNIKVLILGYKTKGRGKDLIAKSNKRLEIHKNMDNLKKRLKELIESVYLVSFDNLAIEQLELKDFSRKHGIKFENLYMGDDGQYTMYVDAVEMVYAVSSTHREKYPIKDTDTIDTIFKEVRKAAKA